MLSGQTTACATAAAGMDDMTSYDTFYSTTMEEEAGLLVVGRRGGQGMELLHEPVLGAWF
jgi:hypothetical protein